jgi:hypothetical protein
VAMKESKECVKAEAALARKAGVAIMGRCVPCGILWGGSSAS